MIFQDAGEESEVLLNTGENGHVLPIPTPVSNKNSTQSASTNSDNVSEAITNDDQLETDRKRSCSNLEVPSPSMGSPELPTDSGDTTEEEDEGENVYLLIVNTSFPAGIEAL